MLKKLIFLSLLVLGTGCAPLQKPIQNDPAFAPKYPTVPVPSAASSGSLFSDVGYRGLFGDAVARQIGDIIIVRLNEQTVSTKSSSTNISKATDTSMPEPTLLGKRISVPPLNNKILTGIGSDSDFSGSADSDQSNSLRGNIAVTIAEILPNGAFVIRGEKWMQLNQGDEFIRITGMVRPVDITSDNSVDSNKIANARITYGGKGVMDDSNRIGWLARFFVNPLFPH